MGETKDFEESVDGYSIIFTIDFPVIFDVGCLLHLYSWGVSFTDSLFAIRSVDLSANYASFC